MTRTISSGLDTHLAGETTTLATCWKITRTDNTVFAFTDHDTDVTIGGVTYKAASGFTPSAVESKLDMSVDNLEVVALFDSDEITEQDLLAGLYDHAEVEVFLVNWNDTSQGKLKLTKGWIGEVSRHRSKFEAELRSLSQALQQTVGEVTSPLCRAELGDARCKVRLDPGEWQASTSYSVREDYDAGSGDVVKPSTQTDPPRHFKCATAGTSGGSEPTWDTTIGNTTSDNTVEWEAIRALTFSGSVTSKTDNRKFEDDQMDDPPTDWFTAGKVTFTSGNNDGLSREVKAHTLLTGGVAELELHEAFPFDVEVGDTFDVTAGCQFRLADCRDKFNNTHNRRAEDYIVGQKEMYRFGGQGGETSNAADDIVT